MAEFGILMAGIVGGSLLLLVTLYAFFRLIGLLLYGIVRLVALTLTALARLLLTGAHAVFDAIVEPRRRHRPA